MPAGTESLKRIIKLWKQGKFDFPVREVRFNQSKLTRYNLILARKVNAAVILLSETESDVMLSTNKQTIDISKKKTEGASKYNELLLNHPKE